MQRPNSELEKHGAPRLMQGVNNLAASGKKMSSASGSLNRRPDVRQQLHKVRRHAGQSGTAQTVRLEQL